MLKSRIAKFLTSSLVAVSLIMLAVSCDKDDYLAESPASEVIAKLPEFPTNPEQMEKITEEALETAETKLNKIASLKSEELSRATVVKALDELFYSLDTSTAPVIFLAHTSKNKDIRSKGFEMEEKVSKFYVRYGTREDVYKILKSFSAEKPKLTAAETKFLKEAIQGFEDEGINLPKEQRDALKAVKNELAELGSQYSKQKNEAAKEAIIFLEESEIGNISEVGRKAIDKLKTEDGRYKIRLAVTGDVIPVYDYVPVEATRKKVYLGRRNHAKDATSETMQKILQRRIKAAKLLGEPSWAHIKLKSKMAKTPETALNFLKDVSQSIRPKFEAEIEELRLLKVEETEISNSKIEQWDTAYYGRLNTEKKLNFDSNVLKPFFEYYKTLDSMIDHYEMVFDITIKFVKDADIPYKWDEEVQLVEFIDRKTEQHLGYLYLDMFPRPEEEKYGHFAQFGLRSNFQGVDNKQIRPVAALVCNFDKPEAGKPSLLTLDNVETLFHEFGHAIHTILTQAHLASQAGTSVARDFVEAPSQFLEYFVTDPTAIKNFAIHYKTGELLPEDLLQKIQDSKLNGVATGYGFQMALANADMTVHSKIQNEDVTAEQIEDVLRDAFAEFYLGVDAPIYMMSSFGHLWGGYDASYYGYAWADVIAADLASKFEASEKGYFDTELGAKYRKEILEVGSSRDERVSIEAFLGRPFNSDAFKKKLGVK